MTPRQVQLIQDFRPEVIMVTPSYTLTIIDEFEKQGIDPASSSLQVGIFGAEPWTEQMRVEIENRTDMHAVDIYGLPEVMGPGVSQECVETKDGLHIWGDHFYPEVIDPIDGVPLRDGEEGELLFPRSPRRPCRSSVTTPATSPGCCPARRARACGGCRRSPAGPTT
jgi:phenylacetate-CoA ligase